MHTHLAGRDGRRAGALLLLLLLLRRRQLRMELPELGRRHHGQQARARANVQHAEGPRRAALSAQARRRRGCANGPLTALRATASEAGRPTQHAQELSSQRQAPVRHAHGISSSWLAARRKLPDGPAEGKPVRAIAPAVRHHVQVG